MQSSGLKGLNEQIHKYGSMQFEEWGAQRAVGKIKQRKTATSLPNYSETQNFYVE